MDLHIDIVHVNSTPHLTSIDGVIKYRAAVPLNSRTAETIYKAMDQVLRHYNKGGFSISEVHADNELEPLVGPIQDELDVTFVPYGQREHVKRAERNNQTIAGNVRAIFHSLPFKAYPKTMTRCTALEAGRAIRMLLK